MCQHTFCFSQCPLFPWHIAHSYHNFHSKIAMDKQGKLTNSLSSQQNFLLENFVTYTHIGYWFVHYSLVARSMCVHDTHRFIATIRECGSPLRQGHSVGTGKPGNCVVVVLSSSRPSLSAYTSATAKAVPYELNNGTWKPYKISSTNI